MEEDYTPLEFEIVTPRAFGEFGQCQSLLYLFVSRCTRRTHTDRKSLGIL